MTTSQDPLDYEFKDEKLVSIASALQAAHGKSVAHDKVDQAQDVLNKVARELENLRSSRVDYAREMADLEAQQKELDHDMTRSYYSLEEQPVKRENITTWTFFSIASVLVYVLAKAAGWYTIFAVIGALIIGFIASMIFESIYTTPKYQEAKEEHLASIRRKNEESRKRRFRDTPILTGPAFENEAQKIQQAIGNIQNAIRDGVQEYKREKMKAIREIIGLAHLDVSITADEFDKDTRGAPVITWDAPAMAMPEFSDPSDLTAESYAKHGHGQFTALVVANEIAVTLSIYINEGRLIENDFDIHCTKIYSDTLSPDGEFTHLEAPVGKTLNYYAVTTIKYLGYRSEGNLLVPYPAVQEITNKHERVGVKAFRSDEEVLDAEIKEHTVKAKRAKFHEKIGKVENAKGSDPATEMARIAKERLEAHQRKQQSEQHIKELRATLTTAGLPEEEIEEAIDEYLQSI